MVHTKHSLSLHKIAEPDDEFKGCATKHKSRSSYRVAPVECEVEGGCELIKSTYDVITKYTRAVFDKQSETVV